MASSTVTLAIDPNSSGEDTITLNGPRSDQAIDKPVPRWVTDLTQGGTRYSYKLNSSTKRIWTLQFDFLTSAQKSDLETFFDTYAEGPENTFTYTHTDGNSYTARFAMTDLNFVRVGPNLWQVTMILEIGAAIS